MKSDKLNRVTSFTFSPVHTCTSVYSVKSQVHWYPIKKKSVIENIGSHFQLLVTCWSTVGWQVTKILLTHYQQSADSVKLTKIWQKTVVHLGDWELEKLFNMADEWNQVLLDNAKKWAKAIIAIESIVQGIFLKWLFPFLCSFGSNKLVNIYDHFSLRPTDRLLTGYWKIANRSLTVGWQSAETLARNISKTVSASCWPSVSWQLANSRLTVSFKNCSSLLLKNLAGTL